MSELVKNTALTQEGLDRLLEQYKGKENIETLLTMYLDSVQEFEDAVFAVKLAFMLEDAVGEQLDFLGAIVGEGRNGKEDELYRVWIGVRIRLNRSFGTPTDVIECLRLATDAPFEYRTYGGAHFAILFSEMPEFSNDLTIITYFAKAAGSSFTFHYPYDLGDGHIFTFKDVDDVDDPDLGFCDVADL